MYNLLLSFIAYLIGSISFGVIISNAFGLSDPRAYGSHNPGATNVLRSGNKIAAALTLSGDYLKGWLAASLIQRYGTQFGLNDFGIALAVVSTLVGHLWPIFFQFSGGKGVATLLGTLIGINFYLGMCTAIIWLTIAFTFRYSSLSALVTSLLSPFSYFFIKGADIIFCAIIVMSTLVIYRHAQNIRNLLSNKEKRINFRKN